MIDPEERSGGVTMPVMAILSAMAGIIVALVIIGDHDDRRGGRVWAPMQGDMALSDESHRPPLPTVPRIATIRAGP